MRWFSCQMFFLLQICYSSLCMFYHKCSIFLILRRYNVEHRGTQYKFCTLFLATAFLLANFSHFSKQFRNQHKTLRLFDAHYQILRRIGFRSYQHIFVTLKPKSQETAQNCKNMIYKSVFELLFTPICSSTPIISKKHVLVLSEIRISKKGRIYS